MRRYNRQHGFTLVELAIVMTIIGLLIGGILKGQELMQNARITATIAQVKSYTAAHTMFRDSYDGLPGDLPNAQTRLPGCNAGNFCLNGDGNSIVGAVNAAHIGSQAGVVTVPQVETSMYWKHLAMADLISGIDVSTNPVVSSGSGQYGRTHPISPVGGGYVTHYFALNTGIRGYLVSGQWLRLARDFMGSAAAGQQLSPRIGALIDRKMDDGSPTSGDVQGSGNGAFASNNCHLLREWHEETNANNCLIFFKLR